MLSTQNLNETIEAETPSQEISREDLLKLGNFVVETANELIQENENINTTKAKTIKLMLSRYKVPKAIKEAIIDSSFTETNDINSDDIENISITYECPETKEIIYSNLREIKTNILNKCSHKMTITHKDNSQKTREEYEENLIRNAIKFKIGNCGECGGACKLIWKELNAGHRKLFNLPNHPIVDNIFMENITCLLEENNHYFSVLNRPTESYVDDMEQWIATGKEVVIVDSWNGQKTAISVNEQLSLPPEKRSPRFNYIESILKYHKDLILRSRIKIGSGHSDRWLLQKQREANYFIKKAHPTFFSPKKLKIDISKNQRYHPYKG